MRESTIKMIPLSSLRIDLCDKAMVGRRYIPSIRLIKAIKINGITDPITVVPHKSGKYTIIDGILRIHALYSLEVNESLLIPCHVKNYIVNNH